ncbi:MAG: hypothetical protein JXK93_12340 [Sphaerochaetaceae bacterium]|nr:hypothetical protein [Sphaerochaetaceae bacterium]
MKHGLNETIQVLAKKHGLDLSMYNEQFLEQIVEKRMMLSHVHDLLEYQRYISGNQDEVDTLRRSVNITHTEFFRNTLTFAHLEQWILPSLFEKRQEANELRIWSAGCSSGQEAYSIAILIENLQARNSKHLRYRIIATDIVESALAQAVEGIYRESEVQRLRLHDVHTFFTGKGDMYEVSDTLKQHVWFHTYDLLDNESAYPHESIFGNFDLVVCSNLLFYYKPEFRHGIMRKLINSMNPNGFLITGEAERQSTELFSEVYAVVPPSPIYRLRRNVQ